MREIKIFRFRSVDIYDYEYTKEYISLQDTSEWQTVTEEQYALLDSVYFNKLSNNRYKYVIVERCDFTNERNDLNISSIIDKITEQKNKEEKQALLAKKRIEDRIKKRETSNRQKKIEEAKKLLAEEGMLNADT